jgi:hypothetical protein
MLCSILTLAALGLFYTASVINDYTLQLRRLRLALSIAEVLTLVGLDVVLLLDLIKMW